MAYSQGEGAVGQPTPNSIWNPGDRFQLPHSFPSHPSYPKTKQLPEKSLYIQEGQGTEAHSLPCSLLPLAFPKGDDEEPGFTTVSTQMGGNRIQLKGAPFGWEMHEGDSIIAFTGGGVPPSCISGVKKVGRVRSGEVHLYWEAEAGRSL